VVLANGDISASHMHQSVLVCDGDVNIAARQITQCVVVARGNITGAEWADTSVLMAGGKVRFGKEIRLTKLTYNVIVEGEPNTLGITFFELLDTLGVLVKVTDGNVIITNYKVQGAFGASGAKIGDIVTEVNGKKPTDAESLRRLLRDALAIGDATVKLKRGDKTETVKVSLPE
jgi:membrane-associated protease RseP (regulator of RpoE activity)